jgi:predicted dehydrogenase
MDLGVVGVGGIAQRHLSNVATIDRVNVEAVCDIDEERADSAASNHGATSYYDYEQLYAEADVDAILVAIPPFAHTTQETLAVEQGLDLFVEKPVALSVTDARKIGAVIENSDVVNQAGYVLRYAEAVDRARELITPDDVAVIEGRYTYPGPPDSTWWQQKDRSGGQVVEQSTHIFDITRYLVGDVDRVTATGQQRHVSTLDFSDTTVATLEHESGVLSRITSTCAARSTDVSIRITGPEVELVLDPLENTLTGTVEGESIDFSADSDPFVTEINAYIEAVETGSMNPVRCDYTDATETLATTLAVTESIDVGESIPVDHDLREH